MSNQLQNPGNADAHGRDTSPVATKGPGGKPASLLDPHYAHPAAQPALRARALASRQAKEVATLDMGAVTADAAVALAAKFAQQVTALGGDAAPLGAQLALQAMQYNIAKTPLSEVVSGISAGIERLFGVTR